MIDVKQYTRWLQSNVTQELILNVQAHIMNHVHGIADDTTEGAVKAHYLRKGAELAINFLVSRPTVETEKKRKEQDIEPDFGAESIRNEELNP